MSSKRSGKGGRKKGEDKQPNFQPIKFNLCPESAENWRGRASSDFPDRVNFSQSPLNMGGVVRLKSGAVSRNGADLIFAVERFAEILNRSDGAELDGAGLNSKMSPNDQSFRRHVKSDGAPNELAKLLNWLTEKLRATFPQISPEKIYVEGPCVVISFKDTGIDVEVAPILYEGDKDWRGYLWDRSTGKRILTSIPLHHEFIRVRKDKQQPHFAQVIRLAKWWVQQREGDTDDFTMRSFL